jgi:hypothetical protein
MQEWEKKRMNTWWNDTSKALSLAAHAAPSTARQQQQQKLKMPQQ